MSCSLWTKIKSIHASGARSVGPIGKNAIGRWLSTDTRRRKGGCCGKRITTTRSGSITSVQAIYVPADDLTDPSPATTFATLFSTVTLSRAITDLGIYPAVDPLDSSSRQLDPNVVGAEHYETAQRTQRVFCSVTRN
ncbi:MAG: hypothetical protein CM1200mP9_09890 [Gammaproteobacteria bacterium]|nr:MAG: hypothetical protein CM1200mP9_09890 [Gammaproteobacteria bacterium]